MGAVGLRVVETFTKKQQGVGMSKTHEEIMRDLCLSDWVPPSSTLDTSPGEGAPVRTSSEPQDKKREPCPACGKVVNWIADGSRPRQHKHNGEVCLGEVVTPPAEAQPVEAQAAPVEPSSQDGLVARVVRGYVKLRDEVNEKKKTFKEEIAKEEAKLDKLLSVLQAQLIAAGVSSMKVEGAGTFFTKVKDSVKVEDRNAFLNWVLEDWENREGFLTNNVSKAQVKEMLEDEKALPPGVGYTTVQVVQVRRS